MVKRRSEGRLVMLGREGRSPAGNGKKRRRRRRRRRKMMIVCTRRGKEKRMILWRKRGIREKIGSC